MARIKSLKLIEDAQARTSSNSRSTDSVEAFSNAKATGDEEFGELHRLFHLRVKQAELRRSYPVAPPSNNFTKVPCVRLYSCH